MTRATLYMTAARSLAKRPSYDALNFMRVTPVSDRPHLSLALLEAGMDQQTVRLLNTMTDPLPRTTEFDDEDPTDWDVRCKDYQLEDDLADSRR